MPAYAGHAPAARSRQGRTGELQPLPAEPLAVVQEMWARIDARDSDGLRALLHPDVVLEYPMTNELFHGADAVVAINAEYPEGWSVHPLAFQVTGDVVLAEVDVPLGSSTFRSVGIWETRGGVIVSAKEYWVAPGSEEPPEWRAKYRT